MQAWKDRFPLNQATLTPLVAWSKPGDYSIPDGAVYGLPTGPRNGIWVLDLDRKNGKDGVLAIGEYASDHGVELPETYTVQTKSGGVHLYFLWTDRPIRNRVGVLDGVDVRGDRGYVRAGGGYVVLDARDPVAAPDWLLDLVTAGQEPDTPPVVATAIGPDHPEWARRVARAEEFIAEQPACTEGEGKSEAQIWKMALRLTRTYELPIDECERLLEPWHARCSPVGYCRPKIRHNLMNAATKGTGPTGMMPEGWRGPTEAAPPAPAAPDGLERIRIAVDDDSWRQVKDPAHRYSYDLGAEVTKPAAAKAREFSAKELAAVFAGPGAHQAWRGVFQYDEFRRCIVAVNPPFWMEAETLGGTTNADLATIQVWLNDIIGYSATIEAIQRAVDVASRQARFHPIRDYLNALPKPTLEEARAYFSPDLASDLWGAFPADSPRESAALRRMAVAAVRRIRKPGTKYDVMVILQGDQGVYKSSFCRRLFDPWYTDRMPPLSSKEAAIALDGVWGVEIGEMSGWLRSSTDEQNNFLSAHQDKYRPPYGKCDIIVPRQCVFMGTANPDDLFNDPTGTRRYDVCRMQREVDLNAFDSWGGRDYWWACACVLEEAGEAIFAGREEAKEIQEANAKYASQDPWEDAVLQYAYKQREAGYVLAEDALTFGALITTDRQTSEMLKRVRDILRRHFGASKVRHIGPRGTKRVYAVCDPPDGKSAEGSDGRVTGHPPDGKSAEGSGGRFFN